MKKNNNNELFNSFFRQKNSKGQKMFMIKYSKKNLSRLEVFVSINI